VEFTKEENFKKESKGFEDESVDYLTKRGEPKDGMTSWRQ